MSEDKRAKILDRVRKLLAKAESTTPQEAELCREKADELMANYAIEQWQLRAAAERDRRGGTPERRDFDWSFAVGSPFRDDLVALFTTIVTHCRSVPVREKVNWAAKGPLKIPVIGLPSDLDYADLLFTTLFLELMRQIDPQPSQELSLDENLAMLREAGLDWQEIAVRLLEAGLLEARYGEPAQDEQRFYFKSRYRRRAPNWYQRTAQKLGARYRAWCRKSGRPQSYADQRIYRKNFAEGFQHKISSRLWRLEQKTEGEGNAMALALRDIHRANREAVYGFFPDLRPHEPGCLCPECERQRGRSRTRKPTTALKPWTRERDRSDWAAYQAGGEAGDKAEIVSGAPRLKPAQALER